MDKDKLIAEAEALASLEGNLGWEIIEKWLKEAIETTKDQLASKKTNDSWEQTLRLQSKYEAYTTLLFLRTRRMEKGLKLKEEKND